MFTGLIEEKGKIKNIKRGSASSVLTIEGDVIFEDLKIGDSVATSGVCLTVTAISGKSFTADVMHESISRSKLGTLRAGDPVNLERAMPADGRFGGHIVSGHIDGVGTIDKISRDDNAIRFSIAAPGEILRYIVSKGSVCIDGISLTVTDVDQRQFGVSVIPHTIDETTLSMAKVGDTVNIENDILGKYVEKLMSPEESAKAAPGEDTPGAGITIDFLRENGF